MENWEKFRDLLDEDDLLYKIDVFDSGARAFRIPQKIKSGNLVDLLIVFDEDNIKILAMKIASIEDPEKLPQCYELFNEMNDNYKYFKVYADSDGDVMVSCDVAIDVCRGEFYPETLMAYIGSALRVVGNVYPRLMKILLF